MARALPDASAEVAPARASRDVRKKATRQRVLDAARELFETLGYENATVRAIAARAGVAVGTVFTSFRSKGEILSEVMQARLGPLYAELDRVTPLLRGSTEDRLKTLFAITFTFEEPRTRLFLSHIMAAYDWTIASGAKPYGRNPRVLATVRNCIVHGVAEGEVDPAADIDAAVQLLIAAYAWCYSKVVTEGADARGLIVAMDRQIAIVAQGLKPR